ncbi:MAG: urate hydroxylase PuuD [Ilumatobacteraceae bacterium]
MNAASLFDQNAIGNFWFRYLHILAGITWIGLLYYFNLVQVPGLAAYGDEGKARNITITQIATRALWWFRWAAIATWSTGILITAVAPDYMKDFMNHGVDDYALNAKNAGISFGMILGITMAANVWMVIWKNQKVVIANATNVLNGGEANPDAATAGRRAMLASRQNTIFSISMLFYMVGSAHYFESVFKASPGEANTFLIINIVLAALLQLNALGKFGGIKAGNKALVMYESHKNAIITGVALWAVSFVLGTIILGA